MKNKSDVLALKYRPQIFKDLIGHEDVATSIFNSIKNNKTSNAYLFTGIRGVGKTTFARIVAKALNCLNGIDKLCTVNYCSNCEAIINSNHIDVLEIDAASKTGVDDVRELIEFSRYAPSIAKFKIYIIDEVHMLSKQAFNALLKTLEEPPKYLKFIFATTEVKKIPITVISRCQRFDLPRIKSEELYNYLKNVAEKEKKKFEDDALKLIVKISEGSVRDSLSLLDRAIISKNENLITLENVQKIFGYVDKSSYIDLVEFILKGDEEKVIKYYRNLYTSGVDANNFLNEFLEILYYIKNINFIVDDGTTFLLNDNDYKKILSLSKKISSSDIILFWEFTLKTIREITMVSNPNLSIEMLLVQLMYLKKKKSKVNDINSLSTNNSQNFNYQMQNKTIDAVNQIKNVKQEQENIEKKNIEKIKNLDDLIQICQENKEMNLKYELENNVNLVSFSENRIEISFNEKLDNNFVKDLSEKLLEWTNKRWIISFSKNKGDISKKEEKKKIKVNRIKKLLNSNEYQDLIKSIPDIELIDIEIKND